MNSLPLIAIQNHILFIQLPINKQENLDILSLNLPKEGAEETTSHSASGVRGKESSLRMEWQFPMRKAGPVPGACRKKTLALGSVLTHIHRFSSKTEHYTVPGTTLHPEDLASACR